MRRLFTWLMLAFVAVVLLATVTRTITLSLSWRLSRQDDTLQTARQDARSIAQWASERWETVLRGESRPALSALARVADARVWLVDAHGNVLMDTGTNPSWEGASIASGELARALAGQESVLSGRSPWLESAMATVVPIEKTGLGVVGAVYLFIPQSSLTRSNLGLGPLLWSAVFTIAVSVLVAYLISKRLSRPVEEITRYARSMGDGELASGVRVRSIAELNDLASTLTYVSGRLKASFDSLAEERQRLSAVLESMQDGVLAVDQAGQLLLANPASARMLRPGELPESVRTGLQDAINGVLREVHVGRGPEQELLAICSPVVDTEGRSRGAVAVLRDVSSVMRLQRARENFVADVAHELRGPLANLSLLAEALGDGTIAWEDRAPFVRTLQSEVAHLTRLSRDVLDLASIDAGVMEVTLEEVGLVDACTAVANRLVARARDAGVELHCNVAPDLCVKASRVKLEQVLFNLADNAVRHTPAGGSVTVTADLKGGMVRIQVVDTGEGIPAEHLPHVFERFYKVDRARSRSEAGTGLGLAVVRQLVELQGGRVQVLSRVGEGTQFTVELPSAAKLIV